MTSGTTRATSALTGQRAETPSRIRSSWSVLDDGTGVAGDTGPQVGALLGHGAVDRGTWKKKHVPGRKHTNGKAFSFFNQELQRSVTLGGRGLERVGW